MIAISTENRPKQSPVMKLATEEKRQAILGEVQATLQMLADTDLKIYGEISRGTLEAVQIQGFAIENGSVKKASPQKPSVCGQPHTARKQRTHPKKRSKGGKIR